MAVRQGAGELLRSLNKLGLTQVWLYFLSVFAAFFVCVPLGIVLRNFGGKCIIFARAENFGLRIYPWEESACDFPLYSSIGVHMIYACVVGLFVLFSIMPRTHKYTDKVGLIQDINAKYILTAMNPVFTVVNLIILFMALSQALIISIGFQTFCESVAESVNHYYARVLNSTQLAVYEPVKSCYDVDTDMMNRFYIYGGFDNVNGKHYKAALLLAAIGAWALLVIWFLQFLLNLSQCCKGCSCKKAEEKQKVSRSMQVAQRRSRMATPIGTPGHMTPRGYGVPGHMTPPVAYPHQPQPIGHQNLAYQGYPGGRPGGPR